MKTISNILDELYTIVNVEDVLNTIDSKVYRLKSSEKDVVSHIVLVPLEGVPVEDVLQVGVINVNAFVPNLSNNAPDENTLAEISEQILLAIENHDDVTNYVIFEIESQVLMFEERDRSFANIRVKFIVEH